MKHKLSLVTLAVLGALMLVVLSGVPSHNAAHAQNSPSVAVELSSTSVTEGTAIAVTMSFGSLTPDDDRSTTDYTFRADVKDSENADADGCENEAGGYGLGVDRKINLVDEDPEIRRGGILADCPAGDYTVRASISDANGAELASTSASFSVAAPEPAPTQDPAPKPETGPTVSIALSPSDTMIGGEGTEIAVTLSFGSLEEDSDRATTDYTFRADVKDSEDGDADGCENQAGGYGLGVDRKINLVDEDLEVRRGTISADCPPGVYTLRASISNSDNAELASATAAFYVLPQPSAVEVDEPEEEEPVSAEQNSADATLSALTVSPTDIIGFASDVTTYQIGVANSVTQATITAATNNANATIAWSTTDAGTAAGHQVTLSEGLNTVTITVTAEDTSTEKAYTIHVARGVTADFGWKASDDFNGLVHAGNRSPEGIWSNGSTMWVPDGIDRNVYAYDLATKGRDRSRDFNTLFAAGNTAPSGIWSDGDTIWVADTNDEKIYAYNLATKLRDASKDFNTLQAAGNTSPYGIWSDGDTMWVADSSDDKIYAYNLATKAQDSGKEFNTLSAAGNTVPNGIWSDGDTMWVADFGDDKIYAYNLATKAQDSGKDFNTLIAAGNTNPTGIWSDGDTMWVLDTADHKIYSYNMPASANATLRELSLSGITLNEDFAADRTAYTATATAASTTVTATPLQGYAMVAITPTDADAADGHQVTLADNAVTTITVTVTAQNGTTRKVYTVAVTRSSISSDATLSALTVSPTDIIGFASNRITYHVGVANSVTQVTITATASDSGATIAWSTTDAGTAAGHQVTLSEGLNTVTITVTAEDTTTRKAYTIHVGRGVTADYGWKATDDFNGLSDAGNTVPRGIWSNGDTMWVSDRVYGKIYAYNLATKARYPGRDFDNLSSARPLPQGIWSDGDTMWVLDDLDDKIYAYNLATKARDASKDFTTLTAAENTNSHGIWSDGETMWVTDATNDKIYAYNLATKQRDSGREFNTLHAAGNTEPQGIWSDSETMWVTDATNDKIYAYNLATKQPDPSKDFNTLNAAGIMYPTGIWSDGDTMWVADNGNDKLYSYNMPPSANANLRELSLSGITLNEDFAADRTAYTATAASTTVTATPSHSAAVAVTGPADADAADGHQVTLADNAVTTITVTVTAQDGATRKVYTVAVTRGSTSPSPSSCGDQTDYVLNSDKDRQPRITSAVYDATLDAVVLEWRAGSDIAGLTGFKIRRIAERGMTEETYADLCDNPEGTDSRPSVGETVRSYADVGVPATWLMIYNVYAIYGDKEVISQTVAAKMSAAHGMVRARISSDGSQTFFDIGWMDKGSLADGYKVYMGVTAGGTTFWSDLTSSDTDPAPQRYASTLSTVFPVGNSYTIRVRHGGTDEDTGTLIGQVTTTVVAPGSTPPRTRSVFAYLSDRDDGNAGTKLTVTWTDDQTCATKYQVGHYIEAVSQA